MLFNLLQTIELLISDYEKEYGTPPMGLILGPPEYAALSAYAESNNRFKEKFSFAGGFIFKYKNYTLYLKEEPGVELMLSYNMLNYYI